MHQHRQVWDNNQHHLAAHKGAPMAMPVPCRTSRKIMAHKTLFTEGQENKGLYEIISGQIMLYKTMQDGRRQIIEIHTKGDVIGTLNSKNYHSTAETLTPCEVQCLPKDTVELSPHLQQKVLHQYERQLERASQHMLLLGRKTALEKVASFLLRFVIKKGDATETMTCWRLSCGEGPHQIQLPMTRQEVADHLGLTIETVSRSLSDLKRRGVVEIRGHEGVTILNACKLCHLDGSSRHTTQ